MFFRPNNSILRTRFYACPHDEGPYVISFPGKKGRQHEEQRQVGYRGNGQYQQFGRAHHQQHSPSDLGCNITTGTTRSSDVLDLPLSGVTLVIGRILGPYDNEDGYSDEGEDDFYHGDRNSDYYRR
ncbi:hypothetical protein D6D19_07482 [Aureobasidium pullulans]|uniref:Uncharacterized protein n=1 Tax=Aureobasidium pullulans TaxID=5580 RepID=A0A4S9KZ01_AURPU|nr:hypothetical protein D6D19_07482 [Aureobasidium pullulans]THY21315.1 hypothetical protein D6D00_07232 [Aureobasidium pullulans]